MPLWWYLPFSAFVVASVPKKSWNLNTCLALSVSSLFYRDVEGVEPAAQRERVYRPENYSWRQRVWSPPKCSIFLQLVFQGPGEKVCLPPFPPAVDPICSFRRAHLCHFSLPLFLSCRFVGRLWFLSQGQQPFTVSLKWIYLKLGKKVNTFLFFLFFLPFLPPILEHININFQFLKQRMCSMIEGS